MSDEEKNIGEAATGTATVEAPPEQPFYDDEHTTEPHSSAPPPQGAPPSSSGKWQMPKPKFQQTSGYLPQGYLKEVEDVAAADASSDSGDDDEQTSPVPTGPPVELKAPAPIAPDIEPQPDIADQLLPEETVPQTNSEPSAAKRGSSIPMILFGLFAIVAFVAVFLGAIYYFFFYAE